jgi:hypothetical protein
MSQFQIPSNLLSEQDLADRWQITVKTLRNWRSNKKGPPFIRIASRVWYSLADVYTYEQQQKQQP